MQPNKHTNDQRRYAIKTGFINIDAQLLKKNTHIFCLMSCVISFLMNHANLKNKYTIETIFKIFV